MIRALFLVAFAWLLLSAQTQPISERERGAAATQERDQRAAKNTDVPPRPGRPGSDLKAPKGDRDPKEKERDERERRDIIAQEDMAKWASRMFWAAFAQAVLSLVGIFLIYVTFKEARRAADSGDRMAAEAAAATAAAIEASKAGQEANRLTRDAQREARSTARSEARKAQRREAAADTRAEAAYAIAERNAKAAADQVDLARDTASKQLRAYIGVLGAKAYYVGQPLHRIVIQIKNFGQTPAFDVTSHTGLYIDTHQTGFPGKGEHGSTVVFAHEFGIVEPGQERIIWIDLPDDWIRENIEALSTGKVRLFSETKIQYSDVGGVDRFRGFCCYLPRLRNPGQGTGDPGVPMTITASGNVDSGVGQWAEVHHLPPLRMGRQNEHQRECRPVEAVLLYLGVNV